MENKRVIVTKTYTYTAEYEISLDNDYLDWCVECQADPNLEQTMTAYADEVSFNGEDPIFEDYNHVNTSFEIE